MRILFYQDPPSLESTMLTWTLGQELILRGHEVYFGKLDFNDADKFKGRFDWVRTGSLNSWPGVRFARQTGAKAHVHLEGLAYYRIGVDSAKKWGYPNELTAEQIAYWKDYYKTWMSAAHEADSCSVNGKNQIEVIENELFGGRKLPNCYRLSCGVDARYALTLPNVQRQDVMVTVSRLEPNKGVMMIAKALALLPQDKLPTWVIVGSGTEKQIDELHSFVLKNRIKTIIRPCFGAEKWMWIKKAKIMLQGWSGLPPGEGLVCETPVLSYNHPDIIEMYSDSIWWARDNDPKDFANALHSILNLSEYVIDEDVKMGKQKLLDGELYACTQEILAHQYEKMFTEDLEPWKMNV